MLRRSSVQVRGPLDRRAGACCNPLVCCGDNTRRDCMRRVTSAGGLLACAACLVLGFFLGSLATAPRAGGQDTAPKPPATLPTGARLGADLYVQTAAEYRACCLQVYKCAELRLETLLQTLRPRPAKPAVVMD